ncbi:hypothetical protein VPHK567_0027 [Vibrio phage K567]
MILDIKYKYKTVMHHNLESLDEKVSALLNDQWELAGSAYSNPSHFFQPMIKQELVNDTVCSVQTTD